MYYQHLAAAQSLSRQHAVAPADGDGDGGGLDDGIDPDAEEEYGSSRVVLPLSLKRSQPTSSIIQPSRDDSILCCSKVLHRHILHNDQLLASQSPPSSPSASAATDPFHISHFIPPSYTPQLPPPLSRSPFPFSLHSQQPAPLRIPTPTPGSVSALISHIFSHTQLNPECAIIALIYIERLASLPPHPLITAANHIPLLVTALLTASKVWDDNASFNVDFTSVFPLFSLQHLGRLERTFVSQLQWTLYISSSEYAKYYFALRSIRRTERVPRWYLQVGVAGGRRVEEATRRSEGEQREMPQSL